MADPMCGSGTLLIEAALQATHTAPGLFRRRWPFQHWPDFEPRRWRACIATAEAARGPWDGCILGNDIHPGALSLAAKYARSYSQLQPLPLPLSGALHRKCKCTACRARGTEMVFFRAGPCHDPSTS